MTISLNKAVVICGKIGSGKSTAIHALSTKLGYKVVSFGSLIRDKAVDLGIGDSRAILQELGYKMFVDLGADKLLLAAIEHANLQSGDRALFDGVRHHLVLSAIKSIAGEVATIFLCVDSGERYRRYVAKHASVSFTTLEQFQAFDDHPIEKGIEEIAGMADLVIDATSSPETVLAQVVEKLATRGKQT
jgi:dephospho-CoA kinase